VTPLSEALLYPKSVAIVGASDEPSKTTGRPLRFLRAAGFAGAIYPINPNRDTVQGERAWPSIEALPETPDHAYIVTPTQAVLAAVEACGKRGVKVATILAAGFSEAGEEGMARERELREIVKRTGIRVVGPSSLGVVNVHQKLLLTANAAFAEPDFPRGDLFVASHSGTMIGALISRGKARGVGFAGLVSAGNEVDLGVGEICAATLDDPNVGAYLLFLETLRHAQEIRTFARGAMERGKPVLAFKLGRSQAGAELSVSHTGALAGEDDVADAFFRDCGIARVTTLDGLIEGAPLARRLPIVRGRKPRVAVVTTTGGGAAMVVDALGVRGVEVPKMQDLTLAGTKYDVMKGALDALLASPDYDLVIATPGSSARYEPHLAVKPVIDSAGAGKPLACFVVPDAPEALAELTRAGVPNFRTPESCADAVAAAFGRAPRDGPPPTRGRRQAAAPHLLDELAAYALISKLGITHAPAEELEDATTLAFPLAVKVLSADIPHKTDVGGVELGITGEAALAKAAATIRSRTKCDRVMVQQMVKGLGEALIGYRVDAQVGPIVMLAAGGVLTEIYRDRSIRLAPVDLETAREMVAEVKAFAALRGYRGRPAGDLEALAAAVSNLSRLVDHEERVMEAELNPVMILEQGRGVVAVDALVRVA
jgi:acyl-CoA synthetase (NDP forming)